MRKLASDARLVLAPAGFVLFIAAAAFGPAMPGICVFKLVTGLPCPGCGITRAILQLLRGDVTSSFATAPAAMAVTAFFALTAVLAVAELTRMVQQQTARKVRLAADRVLLCSLLLAWAVTIARLSLQEL